MFFVFCLIIIICLLIVIKSIRIVPQANAYVVERLGAYQETWEVGLHFMIPFLDRIAKKVRLKEQVVDFAPQPVITQDNVTMLMDLRESKLEDDDILEDFFDRVIENYDYNENYYIILIHAMYDILGRSKDGEEMEDASDEVYQYVMCVICPVSLSKPGLSYDAEGNRMQDRIRDWVVDKPAEAFLFPAFSDRTTDIHEVLYYTKNASELQPEMIERVLGAQIPMTSDRQKEAFGTVISDTLAEECDFETVKNIYENLNDIMEEHAEDPEPLKLDQNDIKKVFENSGVPAEKMDDYEHIYKENAGDKTEFLAGNISDNKKLVVSSSDVDIKVKPDRLDIMRTKVIEGRQCLVIELNGTVSVNGIPVRTVIRK